MPSGEYDPEAVEAAWQDQWVEEETYTYRGEEVDPNTVFSIDSPPPTVSGDLHWGHVYGFTLQDFVARFNRMNGREVFFPFGYDDNGIASERLTEDELGIRHQNFERREFQRKCRDVTSKYEAQFTEKIQALGISIDWEETYQTIEPRVQRISQLSFIDLYEQGREYRKRAPAIWCPECETAISQVETEDDEQDSAFHDIEFGVAGSEESFVISTTRPELLPACVSVFVHPDDDEHEHLVGEEAEIPLFGQHVPIIEDERVDLETGSGIVMCCTFGDQTDIEWYQAHNLDLRVAIDESGTMTEEAGEYEGLSSEGARERIVADLEEAGALLDVDPITHTVNVHERCGTGVEFLVTEQWYIELLDKKEEYLEAGRQMDWYPEKMFTRYKNWIDGLQWDWAISRQRSSGIPFPVWYCEDCGEEVIAEREQLPVDPLSDDPPVDACPECGSEAFTPEDDVLDTWATSSLTPLINAGWEWDETSGEMYVERPELYPMDMRPQGHDIISFWLFHTVVKCYEHTGEVPFDSVMVNGMVLDENRVKMSKSLGNIVAPDEVLEEYPVDAARYWAAGSAVGDDLPYKEKGLRAGEKLLRKLWNASKLVEGLTEDAPDERPDLREIDRWLLAELDSEIEFVTERLEDREFSKARDRLRSFFWHTFCDDYLEIAKQRIRENDGDASAAYTLETAHRRFVKLFAPFLAHVTEELWRDMYGDSEERRSSNDRTGSGSVHQTDWPAPLGIEADLAAGEVAMDVVDALRKYKSDHQLSLNAELREVEVFGDVSGFEEDIKGVMHVGTLTALDEAPDIAEIVSGIDLDYSIIGPEFGDKVPEIEGAIEAGEYSIDDGVLHAAGVELGPDAFEVEEEREYSGEGEMVEVGETVVVVKNE
jgi:valyl-tRNA synthetase